MLTALVWNLSLTTLLAIFLAAACRLRFLRRRPAIRHVLWLLVLIKLVTPPLIPLPVLEAKVASHDASALTTTLEEPNRANVVSGGSDGSPPTASDIHSAVAGPIDTSRDSSAQLHYPILLLMLSLIGTLVLLAWYARQSATLSRWLRRARTFDPVLQKCCSEVALELGITSEIRSYVVDARVVPLLWGCRRPSLVMPRQLLNELSADQLRAVVAHELAHYLRRDHWSNVIAVLVKLLVWWDPVAWWAHREMRAAQELCCDAIAIRLCSRRCYATTLLRAIDFAQTERVVDPHLGLGIGGCRSLLRRFEMIGDVQVSPRMPRWALLLVLISALPLVCVPVRGQVRTAETGASAGTDAGRTNAKAASQAGGGQNDREAAEEALEDPPPTAAADEIRGVEVQLEMRAPDLLLIRGKEEDVRRVADLLRQVVEGQRPARGPIKIDGDTAENQDLAQPEMVVYDLEGHPEVQVVLDPNNDSPIVLGRLLDHVLVRDTLLRRRIPGHEIPEAIERGMQIDAIEHNRRLLDKRNENGIRPPVGIERELPMELRRGLGMEEIPLERQ